MSATEKEAVVSVITPTYNSSQFIGDTIESVLAQRFQDWEMLIVDDCSTDNSVEIAKRYVAQDGRIMTMRLSENSGAAVARNTGIKEAQGRYISFLDSDSKSILSFFNVTTNVLYSINLSSSSFSRITIFSSK